MKRKHFSPIGFIFKLIGFLIFIVLLASLALSCFLYVKYQINVLDVISISSTVRQDVAVDTLASNRFSEEDLNLINQKTDADYFVGKSTVTLSDKELGAYFNNEITNNSDKYSFNIGGTDYSLTDLDFRLLQIELSGRDENKENHLTDFNIVFVISSAKLLRSVDGTLGSLVKTLFPKELYISATVSVDSSTESNPDGYSYVTSSKGLTVNNLSAEQTDKLFEIINKFAKTETGDSLCKSVCDIFVNALIGNDSNHGLYYELKDKGVTDYSFEHNSFVLYTVDTNEKKNITYYNTKNAQNPNKTKYSIKDGIITLSKIEVNGYKFLGWYDSASETAVKVESIDSKKFVDVSLYAKWEVIEYSIEYNLNGGTVEGDNPTKYTVESDDFIIINPQKGESAFVGWFLNNSKTPSLNVTVKKGTYGNLKLFASFDGDVKKVSLYVNGALNTESPVQTGLFLTDENINTLLNYSLITSNGYTVKEWYKDEAMSEKYNGDTLLEDISLYGKWEYIVNCLYFYDYKDKFENGVKEGTLKINSHEELLSYIDYVRFYDIKDHVLLDISQYLSDTNKYKEEIHNTFNELLRISEYQTNSTVSYGVESKGLKYYAVFYISKSTHDTDASLTIDETYSEIYAQQDYVYKYQHEPTRSSDFDNFKINGFQKELKVYTSDQLVYALENGYKPVCEANSPAQKVYEKSKEILRGICDDTMNDIDKTRAIYEWLIFTVSYDNKAFTLAKSIGSNDIRKYDSWYAEGALFKRKAVCEGMAKSFLILTSIENIPTVYVTGNEHAWNKVLIDRNWYGIDVTHGNLEFKSASNQGSEVVCYNSFLFTDEYKESKNYVTNDFKDFKAVTEFNYYDYVSYIYGDKEFDLLVNSKEELIMILNYSKLFEPSISSKYYTIEVAVSDDVSLFETWLNTMYINTGVYISKVSQDTNSSGEKTYILFIEQ